MYPVSQRFLDVVAGSHQARARVQVLPTDGPQFGPAPTGGVVLELEDGDVKLSSTADVKGTIDLTVSGAFWDALAPYGVEVFAERGIDFGDAVEWVPLGYFGVDELSQDDAPGGPIKVSGSDRTARLMRNRTLYPYQVPAGMTHRQLFHRLVNGDPTGGTGPVSAEGYGMFVYGRVPIVWASYDPDQATVPSGQVVEDDVYAYLAKLVSSRGCVLRFARTGELVVDLKDRAPGSAPVYTVAGGPSGNLIRASRKVSRRGVYNIVVARGSDPATPTGYRLAYIEDQASPLRWFGPFGAVPRYYASPLLRTSDQADAAAESVLSGYKGLPTGLSLLSVPNPALDPLDVLAATVSSAQVHLADEVTIPLSVTDPVQIVTRTLNDPPDPDAGTDAGGLPQNPANPGAGGGTDGGTTGPVQTFGVGGVVTPAGAILATADSTSRLVISSGGSPGTPKVYDGKGFKVAGITVTDDDVVVQNYRITGATRDGVSTFGARITVQNCDIAQVSSGDDGDINAVTHFGDGFEGCYNTIGVSAALVGTLASSGSHTDAFQTWNTPTKRSSSGVKIHHNRVVGPDRSDPRYIHQFVQAEGKDSTDDGGGGTGVSSGWLIADNDVDIDCVNQVIHLDDIDDVDITRNKIKRRAGKIVEKGSFSTGIRYWADNDATGFTGSVGVTVTPGSGPGGSVDGGSTGGTVTGTLADRWRIGFADGLSKVNLGVDFLPADGPSDSKGKHVDFNLTQLTAAGGFTWPGYVDLRPDGAVRLTAYVGGAHTPNSTHSRTETRQLAKDGKANAVVSSKSGNPYIWVRNAVVKAPTGRPNICLLQWHTPDDDLCMIQWQGGNIVSTFGDKGRPGTLATGVALGSIHQYMIKLTPTRIEYYFDDMTSPGAVQSSAGADGLYGKIGNYQQSAESYDPVGMTAIVDVYDLEMWMPGMATPAARH